MNAVCASNNLEKYQVCLHLHECCMITDQQVKSLMLSMTFVLEFHPAKIPGFVGLVALVQVTRSDCNLVQPPNEPFAK
jgi:hypothetical protein